MMEIRSSTSVLAPNALTIILMRLFLTSLLYMPDKAFWEERQAKEEESGPKESHIEGQPKGPPAVDPRSAEAGQGRYEVLEDDDDVG